MPPYIPKCTGPNHKHRLRPDQNILYSVVCADCGATQALHKSKDQPLYLKHRRVLRKNAYLVNISVPLDCSSAQLLKEISSQCGIVSNTPAPHITLVEGLLPHAVPHDLLEELNTALANDSSIKIRKLHKVQQRRKNSDLIIADIEVNSMGVRAGAHRIAQSWNCLLPQFPIHITLGTVPRANKESVYALRMARFNTKGLVLGVDYRGMKTTRPSIRGRISEKHSLGEVVNTYATQSPYTPEDFSIHTQCTEEATIASEDTEILDLPPGFDLSFLDFDEDEKQGGEIPKNEVQSIHDWEPMSLGELASYIDLSTIT